MKISIEKACELLQQGQVVALPTETVYGLAAAADQAQAVESIYRLKGRPSNNPLIIHIANKEQLFSYEPVVSEDFHQLVNYFWPGPLTVVLPIETSRVLNGIRAGLQTAAFRMPANDSTLQIISRVGPLVMPSANLSGRPSSTLPEHVEQDFGGDFPVVDGGMCQKGLESTVVIHVNGIWKIIREGSLSPEQFFPILGYSPAIEKKVDSEQPLCPGQCYRHYAPHAKLTLLTLIPAQAKGPIIGFDNRQYPKECLLFSLGCLSQPEKIAANVYKVLRQLDEQKITEALVDFDFPQIGLLRTVSERLLRAAQQ